VIAAGLVRHTCNVAQAHLFSASFVARVVTATLSLPVASKSTEPECLALVSVLVNRLTQNDFRRAPDIHISNASHRAGSYDVAHRPSKTERHHRWNTLKAPNPAITGGVETFESCEGGARHGGARRSVLATGLPTQASTCAHGTLRHTDPLLGTQCRAHGQEHEMSPRRTNAWSAGFQSDT
jgi:hypothetical protein